MISKIKVICAVAFSVLMIFSLYIVFSLQKEGQPSVLPESVVHETMSSGQLYVPEGMSREEAEQIYRRSQSDLPEGMSREEAEQIYRRSQSDLKQMLESAKQVGKEAGEAWLKMTPEERVEAYQEMIDEWESLIPEMSANGEQVEWYRAHVTRLKKYQEWEAGSPQRQKESEQGRRETEAMIKRHDTWKREMIEILSPIAHFEVEEIGGKIHIISWDLNYDALQQRKLDRDIAKPDMASPTSSVTAEPEIRPQDEVSVSTSAPPYDPIKSLSSAQNSLTSWRAGLDAQYFDVFISQSFTPQEIEQYFPTAQERERLKSRTTEAQNEVLSKVRELVSDIPNATADQKRKLARQLVTQNFDTDFAKAVITELEKDSE